MHHWCWTNCIICSCVFLLSLSQSLVPSLFFLSFILSFSHFLLLFSASVVQNIYTGSEREKEKERDWEREGKNLFLVTLFTVLKVCTIENCHYFFASRYIWSKSTNRIKESIVTPYITHLWTRFSLLHGHTSTRKYTHRHISTHVKRLSNIWTLGRSNWASESENTEHRRLIHENTYTETYTLHRHVTAIQLSILGSLILCNFSLRIFPFQAYKVNYQT